MSILHYYLLWAGIFLGFLFDLPSALAEAIPDQVLPSEVEINGVEFVLVPQGWFWYTVETGGRFKYQPPGTALYRNVRVWLDGFYMAKYEARARDLARYMNSADIPSKLKANYLNEWTQGSEAEQQSGWGCSVDQQQNGRFVPVDDKRALITQVLFKNELPATYLSWRLADGFARWMGFRLPTEGEWQKAARGEDQRIWPWGSNYPDDTFALFGYTRRCSPAEVSAYPKGRSPYGVYNMAGNVSEYVADWYNEEFDAGLQEGVRNPALVESGSPIPHEQPKRINKGGRWSQNSVALAIAERRLTSLDKATNRDGVRFAIDTARVKALIKKGAVKIKRAQISQAGD